jgi:hypothetical protein
MLADLNIGHELDISDLNYMFQQQDAPYVNYWCGKAYHSENAWTDAEVSDLPEQTGDAQPGGQPRSNS